MRNIFLLVFVLASCTIPRKYQKGKPFVIKNTIEVKEGNFNKDERSALKQRLNAQLDDSSVINTRDALFFLHFVDHPPVYDSISAEQSAANMQASMTHIGYYRANASYKADTVKDGDKRMVHVQYTVTTGKPTLIDTVQYILGRPDLQQIALQNKDKSFLVKNNPISKAAVLGEISRLVDLYRNNGYYKFSSEELRVKGDTSIEALTSTSDDPFEQLRLFAEAQKKLDSPKIKLAVVLNPPTDSSKIKQYYINNIYILSDYQPGDSLNSPDLVKRAVRKRNKPGEKADTIAWEYYHKRLFRNSFLIRNLYIKKGDLYNQDNFYKTLNSCTKAGVWQSSNILVTERRDSTNQIDLVIELVPGKKFGFEAALEASYSANSNTNSATAVTAGNLLGLSGNVSIANRNVRREAIKMTNSLRVGVEFNLKPDSSSTRSLINSNEVSYSNSILFPRFVFPFAGVDTKKHLINPQSFINTNAAYVNRINLFNLQSVGIAVGYEWSTSATNRFVAKPLNIEFNRLFNKTHTFDSTLNANPFLRYSFNTALVAGSSFSYTKTFLNPRRANRQNTLKINAEESGFPLLVVPLRTINVLEKYLRQYIKADVEYVHSVSFPKSAIVFRLFGGVGIASKQDTTLPFFKQYYGGGANSMRAWPVRGIGRGSQPLAPFSNTGQFNDRTGDMQLEANMEYRFNIAQIIPNSLALKGALFIDAGNVWNLRNSQPGGGTDSAQFLFRNLYKQLGIAAGTGFRLDFNYFVIRFDLGFRFKRPELSYINDGWKIPALSFNDVLKKLFTRGNNDEYRKWRYENFNFTIGISYPF